jgi:CRISPR/Cas system-associated exonuclease Cas4 (RecB family)
LSKYIHNVGIVVPSPPRLPESERSVLCTNPPSSDSSGRFPTEDASGQFRRWYRAREFEKNIENGTPYFNGSSSVPPPERHSPSQLLQCHRKAYYRAHNAPAERPKPTGIFWFGSQFETEVAVPYLRDAVAEDEYVRNSIWIDFTISSTSGDLQIRGETDPVIVDTDSQPLLLTEIKTTSSIEHLDEPKPHHRAQVHAYLYGLTDQSDRTLHEAIILYWDRDEFSHKAFRVEFDPWFWRERVLAWAAQSTDYRRERTLPPATPEHEWECEYCPYRQRCGQGEAEVADLPPGGLLPRTSYPRGRLVDYLQAYEAARLTPTLADQYPTLAGEYGTYDWVCSVCEQRHPIGEIEWNGDRDRFPLCPDCQANGTPVPLSGPRPEEQEVAP